MKFILQTSSWTGISPHARLGRRSFKVRSSSISHKSTRLVSN
uniref:Uncharacterized protein n=1 Tax=Ciona savignyi TaxID=51511 RepID=H2YCJ7_CIOSA